MKIGLVGYQGSGKSTVFEWITGQKPDPAMGHTGQSVMAAIPEPRIEGLCRIYKPKKVSIASLELVDTPGLSRSHEGSAARLAMIREAGCLVLVIDAYGRNDPMSDMQAFDSDLILADMEIVSNRITRVEDTLRKPVPRQERETYEHEHATLKAVLEGLECGKPLRESDMTDDQLRVTRSFRLFGEKPRVVIFNTADDETQPERFTSLSTPETPVLAVPAGLELELARMSPEDRAAFQAEMGVGGADRDAMIRTLLTTSRQRLFLTAGEKEVRTWLLHARRHRPGRGRLDPHRPGQGLHPGRDLRLPRSDAAGQRARTEGRPSRPPGAEGLRHPGRRYPLHSLQQVTVSFPTSSQRNALGGRSASMFVRLPSRIKVLLPSGSGRNLPFDTAACRLLHFLPFAARPRSRAAALLAKGGLRSSIVKELARNRTIVRRRPR